MKKQCSSMVSWGRVMYLLAGLIALSHVLNAEESTGSTIRDTPGGVIAAFPAPEVMMVLHGQNIGSSLLKVCDTNQDGAAVATEVKVALLNWFQQADADTNGALSEVELATALKLLFTPPQLPPGAPPLPEDHALHNLLTKKLMAAVNANNDTWITSTEAIAFVDHNFSSWDANSNGWLDASEFAVAFAQLMRTLPLNPQIRPGLGTFFNGFHAL
jgi:hypothetical protein